MAQLPPMPPMPPQQVPGQTNAPRPRKKGMPAIAIVAIVLGALILVAVVGTALLMPSLLKARELARVMSCQINLSNVSKAMAAYVSNNEDQYPPDMQVLLKQGAITPKDLQCPTNADAGPNRVDYICAAPSTTDDATAIVACEARPFHSDKRNILRADYVTETLSESAFQQALADPKNAHFAEEFRKAGGQ